MNKSFIYRDANEAGEKNVTWLQERTETFAFCVTIKSDVFMSWEIKSNPKRGWGVIRMQFEFKLE